ncbi:MAG TPA: sigma 54-interacting transcriptional regulator [Firmicutes bacterium]|nr:sigma 54-interacting transcriptional regulator [Bacillota bacterium]
MFRYDVQLQEISQNLKTIIDNIGEGIHVVDADGRLVFINETARSLFHPGNFDVTGKHIMEVFTGNRSKGEALLEALKTGRVIVEKEETLFRDDGSILTISSRNIPVKLGSRIIGAVKISRDDAVVAELTRRLIDLQTGLYKSVGAGERAETKQVDQFLLPPAGIESIVGISGAITQLKHDLQKIAAVDDPVVLCGEPGVGQEHVARTIHAESSSARRHSPFIYQSIKAIPGSMVEEVLFGRQSPGGVDAREDGEQGWQGIIGLADGGTLFLRDIDAMPGELLARLVAAMRERRIYRAGGPVPKGVDVRFIIGISISSAAAGDGEGSAGEDLSKAWEDAHKDLCSKVGAIPIFIPPLRDRREDIPHLVAHFISEFNSKFGRHYRGISEAVSIIFQNHSWPGNVRELKYTIERAMLLFEDDLIRVEHLTPNLQHIADKLGLSESRLPATGPAPSSKAGPLISGRPLRLAVENLEIEMMNEAIKKAGGNISRAARLLGIPRQTLQYRLKKYSNLIARSTS